MLQPVIVRPRAAGSYELIAGERRWRASQMAGLQTIPSLVNDAADNATALEVALIENIARADLTVIEEARTIASLRARPRTQARAKPQRPCPHRPPP